MKRKSAIILALVILIGVLFSGCGEGIGLGDETLVFEKGEASCKVKEFSNKSSITEFEIPDEYEGLPVTEIADFSGCNLENAEVIKIGMGECLILSNLHVIISVYQLSLFL